VIYEAIELLKKKTNLRPEEMALVMEEIMSGKARTSDIISFLTELDNKKETVEELTAAVLVMRKYADKIVPKTEIILDTCGTGGDKKGTFNVSTAVAFVACASGITVAKHGNRSVSSHCGSADILEALGVNIKIEKQIVEKCLNEIGIAFLFAQEFHPAMKHAMAARKAIAKKTIFNLLGPLCNPAGATHQLVGVFDGQWTEILAMVLGNLGTVHALVVYGKDGLDEISLCGPTVISEIKRGKIKNYEISPEDFGFKRCRLEDLSGGSAGDNARILLEIFNGAQGFKRDMVVLNSACAIYAADKSDSIKEGIKLASESIDSGKALRKLELLKKYTNG
jgi:anthranilate phosphoribosyltransferase